MPEPHDADLLVHDSDTVTHWIAVYREHIETSNEIAASMGLDAPCARTDLIDCNMRDILLHMIEETARPAGHADIIRETLDAHGDSEMGHSCTVGGIELDVHDVGTGVPVVLVQTALTADELVPLADHLVDRGAYRAIVYHRRGYAGSSRVQGPGSVVRDAADCRDLIDALGLGKVHVVGCSYSGAVGLQLAADAAEHVQTLTLIEPPPVHVPSSAEFRATNARLQDVRRARGPGPALEEFFALVIGPDWRSEVEQRLPGAAAQMQRDATVFFDTDLPALLSWRFDAEGARRITCPVLHIGGSDSGPWFAEVRDLVLSWLPQTEDVLLTGADHSLVLTHTPQVADALADFLGRHPITSGGGPG